MTNSPTYASEVLNFQLYIVLNLIRDNVNLNPGLCPYHGDSLIWMLRIWIEILNPTGATIRLQNGEEMRCRAVVGADGVGSQVAAAIGVPPPNFAGYSAYRYMREIRILRLRHHFLNTVLKLSSS